LFAEAFWQEDYSKECHIGKVLGRNTTYGIFFTEYFLGKITHREHSWQEDYSKECANLFIFYKIE